MNITIRERETAELNPCDCGEYPKFFQRDIHYTDLWLECPKCKKRTVMPVKYHCT